jgi:transcriptional antiterminator NusG
MPNDLTPTENAPVLSAPPEVVHDTPAAPAEPPAPTEPALTEVATTPEPDPTSPPASEPVVQPAEAEEDEEVSAEVAEEEPEADEASPEPPHPAQEPEPTNKRWYVVKVQSGREETIKEAIERRVKKEGLEEYYGQIVVPTERITEMRNGKRVSKERKLYPGYLMVEVEYNDRILYLFRETSGVGDFVGGTVNRPPPPMGDREVERMLRKRDDKEADPSKLKPTVTIGDRVKVKDGTFQGMEGEVKEILEALGHLKVELTIFGRGVPVELEYWQVEEV